MTTEVKATNATATQVAAAQPKVKRVFIGHYKYLHSTPLMLMFEFAGSLKEAKERFRKHCWVFQYKYISVTPGIVDLDSREKKREESGNDFAVDED